MRYLTLSGFLVTAAFLCGCGAPAGNGHEKKYHKIKVHLLPPDGEREFDLSNPKERKDFINNIEEGKVEEIEVVQNPLKFSADLGLWSLVIFVALLLILGKFAWAPMVEGLQKREHSIRQAVDEAKLARQETERLRAQFKAEMDQAFAKIPQMMEEARRNAEKLAAEFRAKAEAENQADRERLRREIELAHDQALQDLVQRTAQLATLISANVLARSLTPEDHQRMFNIAVEELKNSGPRLREEV